MLFVVIFYVFLTYLKLTHLQSTFIMFIKYIINIKYNINIEYNIIIRIVFLDSFILICLINILFSILTILISIKTGIQLLMLINIKMIMLIINNFPFHGCKIVLIKIIFLFSEILYASKQQHFILINNHSMSTSLTWTLSIISTQSFKLISF